jgi:hypothetical protein
VQGITAEENAAKLVGFAMHGSGTEKDIRGEDHVEVPSATATAIGEVHSFQGGNCVIEVGHAIVQYADAYLANAFMPGNDLTVRVELDAFSVHDFEAHADMRFTVLRGSSQLFQKTYQCMGAGYAARVIFAGGFAMKSSMRKTTDEALRQCFGRFLIDAKAESPTWHRPPRDVASAPARQPRPIPLFSSISRSQVRSRRGPCDSVPGGRGLRY